ncbi:MAG: nucleotidyltransferase domain-containing protein [Bacillota bacterium]
MYREEFERAIRIICQAAQEIYKDRLVSVAVFGSVGRGTPRPDSDIDLLVVAENLPGGRLKRMAEFAGVEEIVEAHAPEFRLIKPDLSPVIKEKSEVLQGSLLFLDLVDDVKICYDRGNFLFLYLDGLKRKLQQMGAQRVYRGGAWYWVLKENYRPGEMIEI